MADSSRHRGWKYDHANTRLEAFVDGVEAIRMDVSSDGCDVYLLGDTPASNYVWFDASGPRLKINSGTAGAGRLEVHQGDLKIHDHDVASGYVAEFKIEYTATGTHQACDLTVQAAGDMAACNISGYQCTNYVASGHTITGISYMDALNGEFTNQGTINCTGGVFTCARLTIMASTGTWTKHGILTPLWLDCKETATLSSGSYYMMYLSQNGTTALDSWIYSNMGSSTCPFFTINNSGGTTVSGNTSGGSTLNFTNWKTIKIDLGGTTHYLVAAQTIA